MKVGAWTSAVFLAVLATTLVRAEPDPTSERFFVDRNGGGFEVIVNDPADKNTLDAVQKDLRQAAAGGGTLASPELQQHGDRINYRFEKTDRGGRVRISPKDSKDTTVLRSIQGYLKSRMGAPEPVAFSFINDTSLVALPVMVNGSGPYRFLLDTGATNSIVSASLADYLKMKISRRDTMLSAGGDVPITMRTIDRLQVGDATLEKVEIAVANFALLRDLGVDGILGADYLRRFKIAIDYEKKVVQIEANLDSGALAIG